MGRKVFVGNPSFDTPFDTTSVERGGVGGRRP